MDEMNTKEQPLLICLLFAKLIQASFLRLLALTIIQALGHNQKLPLVRLKRSRCHPCRGPEIDHPLCPIASGRPPEGPPGGFRDSSTDHGICLAPAESRLQQPTHPSSGACIMYSSRLVVQNSPSPNIRPPAQPSSSSLRRLVPVIFMLAHVHCPPVKTQEARR